MGCAFWFGTVCGHGAASIGAEVGAGGSCWRGNGGGCVGGTVGKRFWATLGKLAGEGSVLCTCTPGLFAEASGE
eukprot:2474042-Alexandrium_andersonii.AAC.1